MEAIDTSVSAFRCRSLILPKSSQYTPNRVSWPVDADDGRYSRVTPFHALRSEGPRWSPS